VRAQHQLAALAIDALGELGILYQDGPHLRAKGSWQRSYMFDLGLIIGGGTAQSSEETSSPSAAWPAARAEAGGALSDGFLAHHRPADDPESLVRTLAEASSLDRVRRFAATPTDKGRRTSGARSPTSALTGVVIPEEFGGLGLNAAGRSPWRRRRWRGGGAGSVSWASCWARWP